MEEYESCTVQDLEGGGLLLCNVALPEGELSAVFLGPGGVCAVTQSEEDLPALYQSLRSLLGVVRVSLYLSPSGHYDPYLRTVTQLPGGAEQVGSDIRTYLSQEPVVNTPDKIQLMREKLFCADANTRGCYRDEGGTLYLRRGERFCAVSDLDPEQQFRLTLFGGFLGLHRFAAGKYASGVLYLLTCGLFAAGWLLDILQLFLGLQRDKGKAIILPPENRKGKLVFLLPAIALGAAATLAYVLLLGRLLDSGGGVTLPDGILRLISDRFGV